ncbi:MAG: hypothetical protein KME64_22045 [Scytonematopsis contorta HA4267-MV1]|jgi:hypothetical protein|nr:hypothetical protein [Scytonematopsis contorta HA4267-MV1]
MKNEHRYEREILKSQIKILESKNTILQEKNKRLEQKNTILQEKNKEKNRILIGYLGINIILIIGLLSTSLNSLAQQSSDNKKTLTVARPSLKPVTPTSTNSLSNSEILPSQEFFSTK